MKVVLNPTIGSDFQVDQWFISGEDPRVDVQRSGLCYSLVLGETPHIEIWSMKTGLFTKKIELDRLIRYEFLQESRKKNDDI